jgi:hypothetical protein
MSAPGGDIVRDARFRAIFAALPDDPQLAVSLAISVAAAACISAGVMDDRAVAAFDDAIRAFRAGGLRKAVQ